MEGHSDKSSSLSVDSGGLIDLSVLDSDCKTGDSSLGKTIRVMAGLGVHFM